MPTQRHTAIQRIKLLRWFFKKKRSLFQYWHCGKSRELNVYRESISSSNPVTWQTGLICPTFHNRTTQELNNALTTEDETMCNHLVYLRELRYWLKTSPKEGRGAKTNQVAKQGRELNWEAGSRVKSNPGKEELCTLRGTG